MSQRNVAKKVYNGAWHKTGTLSFHAELVRKKKKQKKKTVFACCVVLTSITLKPWKTSTSRKVNPFFHTSTAGLSFLVLTTISMLFIYIHFLSFHLPFFVTFTAFLSRCQRASDPSIFATYGKVLLCGSACAQYHIAEFHYRLHFYGG